MVEDDMIYTFISIHLMACVDQLPTTLDLNFFEIHFDGKLDQFIKAAVVPDTPPWKPSASTVFSYIIILFPY